MATKKEKEEAAAAAAAAAATEKDPPAGDPPAQDPPAGDPQAQDPPAEEKPAKKAASNVVELKDKDTGFYDPTTGFQVVRDQQVKLGSTVGEATRLALESGRLLVVGK